MAHEFVVFRGLHGDCDGLKPRQGGSVLFRKLMSRKEFSKELFDGHRPKEVAMHVIVHTVALEGVLRVVENLPALLRVRSTCELWIVDTVGAR